MRRGGRPSACARARRAAASAAAAAGADARGGRPQRQSNEGATKPVRARAPEQRPPATIETRRATWTERDRRQHRQTVRGRCAGSRARRGANRRSRDRGRRRAPPRARRRGPGERGQPGRGADQRLAVWRRLAAESREVGSAIGRARRAPARPTRPRRRRRDGLAADGAARSRARAEKKKPAIASARRAARPTQRQESGRHERRARRPRSGGERRERRRRIERRQSSADAAISNAPPPLAASLHSAPFKPPGTTEKKAPPSRAPRRARRLGLPQSARERLRGEFEARDRRQQAGCKTAKEKTTRGGAAGKRREHVDQRAHLGGAHARAPRSARRRQPRGRGEPATRRAPPSARLADRKPDAAVAAQRQARHRRRGAERRAARKSVQPRRRGWRCPMTQSAAKASSGPSASTKPSGAPTRSSAAIRPTPSRKPRRENREPVDSCSRGRGSKRLTMIAFLTQKLRHGAPAGRPDLASPSRALSRDSHIRCAPSNNQRRP